MHTRISAQPGLESPGRATPISIRLPKPGTCCPHTGLSRTALNELILPGPANDYRPPVRSGVKKKHRASRGVRIIEYKSLMAYVEKLFREG